MSSSLSWVPRSLILSVLYSLSVLGGCNRGSPREVVLGEAKSSVRLRLWFLPTELAAAAAAAADWQLWLFPVRLWPSKSRSLFSPRRLRLVEPPSPLDELFPLLLPLETDRAPIFLLVGWHPPLSRISSRARERFLIGDRSLPFISAHSVSTVGTLALPWCDFFCNLMQKFTEVKNRFIHWPCGKTTTVAIL